MRQFRLMILAIGIWSAAIGQNIYKTGMLFGENFVFYMTAPSGWVLDNQSGVNQGLHMVFYPEGGTWKDSPVVAYGNSTPLTDEIMSVEDLVKKTVQKFRRGSSFYIKSSKQKTISLTEGKKAEIYYYSGDQWGKYEAVGYIRERKTINSLVYTARAKSVFEANLDKFFEILGSYKNVFKEGDDNYDEQIFNALKTKAAEAKSTVQGKEYEDLLTKTLTKNIGEIFRQCLTYSEPKENVPKIGLVFIIGEDGRIGDSYVWPVTPLSLCVKGTIVGREMPAHKLGKFYWHVFLDSTVDDKTINVRYGDSSEDEFVLGPPKNPAEFLKIGMLSPNPLSVQGFFNAYEYWASFKPGSFVTFKIVSTGTDSTRACTKTFTVKEVTAEKTAIECQESFEVEEAWPQGTRSARARNYSFVVWVDTPPWEKEDLFHGFLSLNILDQSRILIAADASSDTDEVEIKGVPVKSQRVNFRLRGLDVNTMTITFWYVEDIPGGIARFRREVIAPVPLQEDILVENFLADRREIGEYRELTQKPRPRMKASTYLGKTLRFFREAQVVEEGLVSLVKYGPDYDEAAKRVGSLLEKARQWRDHFEEDLRDIDSRLSEKERQKLESFLRQAAEYCSVSIDQLDTLDRSLRKASKTTGISESFLPSVRDKIDEIGALKSQSFMKYITARNDLKGIEITIIRQDRADTKEDEDG